MPTSKKPSEAAIKRELHTLSTRAFELAKAAADKAADESDKADAAKLAAELPALSAKAKELSPDYQAEAARVLSEARLDLAFAKAGGGIPSSIRIGRYISENAATD